MSSATSATSAASATSATSATSTDVEIDPDERLIQERIHRKMTLAGGLAAMGIVYGDIGTSPLYAMQTMVEGVGGKVDPGTALGLFSLVIWTLLITVSLKYCVLVMRADNAGEGGILALMSLLGLNTQSRRWLLVMMGLFGAALLYGDGVITPAISVMSAVEGINVATPALQSYVLPIAVGILLALFAAQTFGTARIGRVFGPVMLLWFITIAVLGALSLRHHLGVLAAVDPLHAVRFLIGHPGVALAVLGGVFLTVTGGEALYADMGHVGRTPIRVCWFAIVLPALLLAYGGMTAMLLDGAPAGKNPFFLLVPGWAVVPLVVLATFATIIASQAIITGAFSMTRQGMQLGWFPGLTIRQTSDREYGQIYVPVVNWLMMVCTLAIAIGFGSSDRLAGAYGTAVSTTMLATTVLLYNAMTKTWHWPALLAVGVAGVLLVVDVVFFGANLVKIAQGGWVPLLLGLLIYLLMTTWRDGAAAVQLRLTEAEETPEAFHARLEHDEVPRVDGTAVFLTRADRPIPSLMIRHVRQFGVLPHAVVSLSILFTETPRVPGGGRVTVVQLADHAWHVTVRYGFMEVPNLTEALAAAASRGCDLDIDGAVFFGAGASVTRARTDRLLPRWRLAVFSFLYRNGVHAGDRFDLPTGRFVEIGRRVEL
jgi:KUP system potassium uptake protein